jgi:phosphohistidine phosphatase
MPDSTPPSWFYRQSGVIPYRVRDGAVEVALVTSRSGKRWVIPKGVIDPGETAPSSAAREAEEEAGLAGRIGPDPVGTYTYDKWGGTCSVEVFLLAVEHERETWEEMDQREREWMSPEDAAQRIREPALAALVARLRDLI